MQRTRLFIDLMTWIIYWLYDLIDTVLQLAEWLVCLCMFIGFLLWLFKRKSVKWKGQPQFIHIAPGEIIVDKFTKLGHKLQQNKEFHRLLNWSKYCCWYLWILKPPCLVSLPPVSVFELVKCGLSVWKVQSLKPGRAQPMTYKIDTWRYTNYQAWP